METLLVLGCAVVLCYFAVCKWIKYVESASTPGITVRGDKLKEVTTKPQSQK